MGGDDDGSMIIAHNFKEQSIEAEKRFKFEELEDPKTKWEHVLYYRPLPNPWLYTMIEGGIWCPFRHGTTVEKIASLEIECQLPSSARYHTHASRSGNRVALFPDEGILITAHSVIFPDGRVWDSTSRTLTQLYKSWEGNDQQPKG